MHSLWLCLINANRWQHYHYLWSSEMTKKKKYNS